MPDHPIRLRATLMHEAPGLARQECYLIAARESRLLIRLAGTESTTGLEGAARQPWSVSMYRSENAWARPWVPGPTAPLAAAAHDMPLPSPLERSTLEQESSA